MKEEEPMNLPAPEDKPLFSHYIEWDESKMQTFERFKPTGEINLEAACKWLNENWPEEGVSFKVFEGKVIRTKEVGSYCIHATFPPDKLREFLGKQVIPVKEYLNIIGKPGTDFKIDNNDNLIIL